MRAKLSCWLLGLVLVATVPSAAQVMSAAKRQTDLDKAKAALAPRTVTLPPSDPFHPEAFNALMGVGKPEEAVEGGDAKGLGPRNPRELLRTIAAGLKPSGVAIFNGEPTLIFGQKKVKSGGILTITFEGAEYTLEITSVSPPNFTLRLNREEFTRPIK